MGIRSFPITSFQGILLFTTLFFHRGALIFHRGGWIQRSLSYSVLGSDRLKVPSGSVRLGETARLSFVRFRELAHLDEHELLKRKENTS